MNFPEAMKAAELGGFVYRDAWPASIVDMLHGQLRISRYGCPAVPWDPKPADRAATDWRDGTGVHYLEPR
jgi:hypothetical protein